MQFINQNTCMSLSIQLFEPSVIYAQGITSFLQSHFKNATLSITHTTSLTNNKSIHLPKQYDLVMFHVPAGLKEASLSRQLNVIKRLYPKAKIILHSMEYHSKVLAAIFTKGLNGYFLLSEDPEELAKVVSDALDGSIAISEKILLSYLCDTAMKKATLPVVESSTKIWPLLDSEVKTLELLSFQIPASAIIEELRFNKRNWSFFMNTLVKRFAQQPNCN
jgi:DNA-binding NarL/FixJ family response regulator